MLLRNWKINTAEISLQECLLEKPLASEHPWPATGTPTAVILTHWTLIFGTLCKVSDFLKDHFTLVCSASIILCKANNLLEIFFFYFEFELSNQSSCDFLVRKIIFWFVSFKLGSISGVSLYPSRHISLFLFV